MSWGSKKSRESGETTRPSEYSGTLALAWDREKQKKSERETEKVLPSQNRIFFGYTQQCWTKRNHFAWAYFVLSWKGHKAIDERRIASLSNGFTDCQCVFSALPFWPFFVNFLEPSNFTLSPLTGWERSFVHLLQLPLGVGFTFLFWERGKKLFFISYSPLSMPINSFEFRLFSLIGPTVSLGIHERRSFLNNFPSTFSGSIFWGFQRFFWHFSMSTL